MFSNMFPQVLDIMDILDILDVTDLRVEGIQ